AYGRLMPSSSQIELPSPQELPATHPALLDLLVLISVVVPHTAPSCHTRNHRPARPPVYRSDDSLSWFPVNRRGRVVRPEHRDDRFAGRQDDAFASVFGQRVESPIRQTLFGLCLKVPASWQQEAGR